MPLVRSNWKVPLVKLACRSGGSMTVRSCLGATPCIWVAPALWGNKETGLLDVIKKNSSPCRHFDSNRLTPDLPRGGDKIHPNPPGHMVIALAFLKALGAEL